VTLKSGLEVTQGHWNWCHSKARVRFLFVFYSNYGNFLYRLRDIATYWLKIANFFYTPPVFMKGRWAPRLGSFGVWPSFTFTFYHLYLALPQGWSCRNFVKMFDNHKTRMTGLSYGEETITICWVVSIEYRNVTDRRTELLYQYRASVCWCAIKTKCSSSCHTALAVYYILSARFYVYLYVFKDSYNDQQLAVFIYSPKG